MTEKTKKPISVHKDDVRKHFREASKTLIKEIEKGDIKRKTPTRVISEPKGGAKVSQTMQQMRGKYILGKLGSKLAHEIDLTHVKKSDMFSACRLSFDGMKYNKKIVEAGINAVSKAKKPSMQLYHKILSPLGNFIIGYKVLSKYCIGKNKDFIKSNELAQSESFYKSMKTHVEAIDVAMVDEPRLYHATLTNIKRKHGVKEPAKKHQAPVLYNVDGRPIKYYDLFDMDEMIAEYEATHWDKNAIWRGAKTTAFKKWLNQRT